MRVGQFASVVAGGSDWSGATDAISERRMFVLVNGKLRLVASADIIPHPGTGESIVKIDLRDDDTRQSER